MNPKVLAAAVIAFMTVTWAPSATQDQDPGPPTIDALRGTVSRLRGNRIETPNDWDALTPEQKQYAESVLAGPRTSITGPLGVMMVSPVLGDLVQKATAYARFAGREGFGSVPPKLNELAILVVARHWSAEYVWNAHHTAAVRLGVPPDLVEAIRTDGRPGPMEPDIAAVYHFATELMELGEVSDARLQTVKEVLGGDRGVVDLVGTMGLYQISSMMVSVDQTPLPEGTAPYLH